MSVIDYFTPDQEVEIEFFDKDREVRLPAVVKDVKDMSVMVRIANDEISPERMIESSQATISGTNGDLGFNIHAQVVECTEFPLVKLIPKDESESVQRRDFVRIEDSLPCTYSLLEKEECEKATMAYLGNSVDTSGVHSLLSKIWHNEREVQDETAEMETAVIQLLINIDRKLSMVLDMVNQERKLPRQEKEARVVDISGSGVKFFTDEVLVLGQTLKVEMVLPTFPVSPITVFGDVTRVEKDCHEEQEGFNIIVKFNTISEDHQDSLIRYIFQRQREILRSVRGSSGEID